MTRREITPDSRKTFADGGQEPKQFQEVVLMPQQKHAAQLAEAKNGQLIENRRVGEGVALDSLEGMAQHIWRVRHSDGTEAIYSTNEMAPKLD